MRAPAALIALTALTTFANEARAAVTLAIDCYLPPPQVQQHDVKCSDLENAFFSNAAYARPSSAEPADARMTIRAMAIAEGVAYSIDVASTRGATFSFVDRVPLSFARDAVQLRLVGNKQRSTAHLFIVDEATTDGDVLTLKLRDPDAGPSSARRDDATTGWYVAPSLNLTASIYGIRSIDAVANVETNWSHPAWRVKAWTWAGYRYIATDDPTGTLAPADREYQNLDLGTDGYVVRTLFDGVSLGANVYGYREPRRNLAFVAGALVGVEWMLKPFVKTDDGNFGVRYEIGAEHHDYVLQSVLLKQTDDFMKHRLRVFGTWHFSRVDVDGGVVGFSVVDDLRFSGVEAYAGLTWRILDDLSLETWSDASFRNGLLNEPKDLSELHPLEQFYGGGSYGDIVASTWIGVRYTFGNSLLKTQDQRWK